MKARSRAQIKLDRRQPHVPSEGVVIDKLTSMGIPALPGKALSQQRADVIAWGAVLIEVKSSSVVNGKAQFGFSPSQRNGHLRGEIVVLVAQTSSGNEFYVFPVSHPIFFRSDGKMKASVGVTFNPHRHKNNTQSTLDAFKMARDNWSLIEQRKQVVCRQLMSGDVPFYMKAA